MKKHHLSELGYLHCRIARLASAGVDTAFMESDSGGAKRFGKALMASVTDVGSRELMVIPIVVTYVASSVVLGEKTHR